MTVLSFRLAEGFAFQVDTSFVTECAVKREQGGEGEGEEGGDIAGWRIPLYMIMSNLPVRTVTCIRPLGENFDFVGRRFAYEADSEYVCLPQETTQFEVCGDLDEQRVKQMQDSLAARGLLTEARKKQIQEAMAERERKKELAAASSSSSSSTMRHQRPAAQQQVSKRDPMAQPQQPTKSQQIQQIQQQRAAMQQQQQQLAASRLRLRDEMMWPAPSASASQQLQSMQAYLPFPGGSHGVQSITFPTPQQIAQIAQMQPHQVMIAPQQFMQGAGGPWGPNAFQSPPIALMMGGGDGMSMEEQQHLALQQQQQHHHQLLHMEAASQESVPVRKSSIASSTSSNGGGGSRPRRMRSVVLGPKYNEENSRFQKPGHSSFYLFDEVYDFHTEGLYPARLEGVPDQAGKRRDFRVTASKYEVIEGTFFTYILGRHGRPPEEHKEKSQPKSTVKIIPKKQEIGRILSEYHKEKHGGINKARDLLGRTYKIEDFDRLYAGIKKMCPSCANNGLTLTPSGADPVSEQGQALKAASTSANKSSSIPGVSLAPPHGVQRG